MNGPIILYQLVHPSPLIGGVGAGCVCGERGAEGGCGDLASLQWRHLENRLLQRGVISDHLDVSDGGPRCDDLVSLISMQCPPNYVIPPLMR